MMARPMPTWAFTDQQRARLKEVLNDNGIAILEQGIAVHVAAKARPIVRAPVPTDPAVDQQRLSTLKDAVQQTFGADTKVTSRAIPAPSSATAPTPGVLRKQLLRTAEAIERALSVVRALPRHEEFAPEVGYQLTPFEWTTLDLGAETPRRGSVAQWLDDGYEFAHLLRSGAADLDVGQTDHDVQNLNRSIGLSVFISTRDLKDGDIRKVLRVLCELENPLVSREPERALVQDVREATRSVPAGPALCGDWPVGTPIGRLAAALRGGHVRRRGRNSAP